jgi:hypothetical protein
VNGYPPICDTYQTIHPAAAKPGTLILVHGGLHTYDNQLYWKDGKPQFSYWLHGMITLVANGTAEHPIRIQAAGDGEPILDGAGAGILLNLRSADHLHIEGLTFRNCGIAIWGGFQGERGGGCLGLTVRQCWFENLVTGIMAQDGRSVDFTITDNVFLGRNPLTQVNGFGRTVGGYAVNLGGQGHTVAWNHAAGFWDGINVFTSALADPQYGQQARAIDIEHNDLSTCSDQFIETDGGFANIRVIGNRMVNCSSQPISCQPVHAGPVYWIRNILWNVHGGKGAMKEHSGAQAYVFLHNTSSTHMMVPFHMSPSPDLCTWWIRNNLCLGPTTVPTQAQYLDADAGPRMVISHNAYRASVPKGVWKVGKRSFDALAALTQATGLENGSILVDGPAIFARASDPVHHAKIGSPVITAESIDLTPTHGVVDAGIAIPGVNDGYVGKAPDIGAIESGQPAPSWGPRHSAHPERLAALRAGTYQPAAEPAP